MTVEQLIDKLQTVKNKKAIIGVEARYIVQDDMSIYDITEQAGQVLLNCTIDYR